MYVESASRRRTSGSRVARGLRLALLLLGCAAFGACSRCGEETQPPTPPGDEPRAEQPSPGRLDDASRRSPLVTLIPSDRERPPPRPSRYPRAPANEEYAAWREQQSAEIESLLGDPDPYARAEGIAMLEPVGRDLGTISELLANDPSPVVRMAAAEQLEASESPQATRALLGALDDPDPEVVVVAIEVLELVADENVVPQLALYRNHPDPEVREMVEDAIELLE